MSTPPATAAELRGVLGDVDDLALERIVETGATLDEVGEALELVEAEQGFGEQPGVPSSTRVTEVRAILAELAADAAEADLAAPDDDRFGGHPV